MGITFNCPGCESTLRVGEELAGRECRCPQCSRILNVPAVAGVTAAEVPTADTVEAEPGPVRPRAGVGGPVRFKRKQRPKRSGSRRPLWFGLAAVALLALFAIGLTAFFLAIQRTELDTELRYLPDDAAELDSHNLETIRGTGAYEKVRLDAPDYLASAYGRDIPPELQISPDDLVRITLVRRENGVKIIYLRGKRVFDAAALQKAAGGAYREVKAGKAVYFSPELGPASPFFVDGKLLICASTATLEAVLERNRSAKLSSNMRDAIRKADFSAGEVSLKTGKTAAPAVADEPPLIDPRTRFAVIQVRFGAEAIERTETYHCPDSEVCQAQLNRLQREVESRRKFAPTPPKEEMWANATVDQAGTLAILQVRIPPEVLIDEHRK